MNIVNTSNVDHYKWGKDCDGWHLLRSQELSVIEERVPPGEKEERHCHTESQQFFYILSGTAQLEVDGTVFDICAGNGMHVPAGIPHQLMNNGDQDIRFLAISQPLSHGDRIKA
ncbi:MAG: cupin domain-containing protein [Pseudomonadota bacterium]|nr:cupin domain-containing protein [Pseudomonadota bacterium]